MQPYRLCHVYPLSQTRRVLRASLGTTQGCTRLMHHLIHDTPDIHTNDVGLARTRRVAECGWHLSPMDHRSDVVQWSLRLVFVHRSVWRTAVHHWRFVEEMSKGYAFPQKVNGACITRATQTASMHIHWDLHWVHRKREVSYLACFHKSSSTICRRIPPTSSASWRSVTELL